MRSCFSGFGFLPGVVFVGALSATSVDARPVRVERVIDGVIEPGFAVARTIDGSGLPAVFDADTPHAPSTPDNCYAVRGVDAAENRVEATYFISPNGRPRQLLIWNAHGGVVGGADSLQIFTLNRAGVVDFLDFPLELGRVGAQRLPLPDNGAVEYRLQVRNSRGDLLVGLNEVQFDDEVCRVGALCLDSDGDGVYDQFEVKGDTDGDGIEDRFDDDDDNDRIPTIDEATIDSDGDGIKDYLDTDSDNDGLFDGADAQRLNPCVPLDGPGCSADVDGDGLSAREEIARGTSFGNADTDNDGLGDRLDGRFDGDGNGIVAALDRFEFGPTCGDGQTDCDLEECDDGNRDRGDGCSAACTRERETGPQEILWRGLVDGDFGDCSSFANGLRPQSQDTLVFDAVSGDLGGAPAAVFLDVAGIRLEQDTTAVVSVFLNRGFVQLDGGTLNLPVVNGQRSVLTGLTATGGRLAVAVGATDNGGQVVAGVQVSGDVFIDGDVDVDLDSTMMIIADPGFGNSPVLVDLNGHRLHHIGLGLLSGEIQLRGDLEAETIELITIGAEQNLIVTAPTLGRGALTTSTLRSTRLLHNIGFGGSAPITIATNMAARSLQLGATSLVITATVQLLPGAASITGVVDRIAIVDVPVGTTLTTLPVGRIELLRVDGVASLTETSGLSVVDAVHVRGAGNEPVFAARDGQQFRAVTIETGLFVGAANLQITELLQHTGGSFLAGADTTLGGADIVGAMTVDIGDVAFSNLTFGAARTEVGPRTVLRVSGTLTALGSAAVPHILIGAPGRAGEQWSVLAAGTVVVDHVAVGDSLNLSEQRIEPADFTDFGNNTRWGPAFDDICGALVAVAGDVNLNDDAAVLAFNASGVQCVTGDVVIGAAVTAVVLEHLRIIGGTLRVIGTQVVTLDLGALDSAGGIAIEGNASLTNLDLSGLENVDDSIVISGNALLPAADFTELEFVGGDVEIDDNASLATVTAPALTAVGGNLAVTDNPTLGGLTLLLLTSAGAIEITGNDALIALVLALLAQVDGNVSVTNNGALTVLTVPSLASVGGDLQITGNDELEVVSVGAAAIGGDLVIDEGVLPGSVCGDGRRFRSEGCDDGNTVENDGCDDGCVTEVGFVCTTALDRRSVCRADGDNDGVADSDDRCPRLADDQTDTDSDGIGDACDNDDDDDGIADDDDDCPLSANAGRACDDDALSNDLDGDGIDDSVDNCRPRPNVGQLDTDGNGVGNACSGLVGVAGDRDGDGLLDENDPCPGVPDDGRGDGDGDGLGDACDSDIDGDGVLNGDDVCVEVVDDQLDGDGDGRGDACDACPGLAGDVRGCPAGRVPPPAVNGVVVAEGCASTGGGSSWAMLSALGLLALGRRRRHGGAAIVVVALLGAVSASATTRVWNGAGDGRFSVGANWLGGVAPLAGDDVVMTSGPGARLDASVLVNSIELSIDLSCDAATQLTVVTSTVIDASASDVGDCVFAVSGAVDIDGTFTGTLRSSSASLNADDVAAVVGIAGVTTADIGRIGVLSTIGGVVVLTTRGQIDAMQLDAGFVTADAGIDVGTVVIDGGVLSSAGRVAVARSLRLTSGSIVGRPVLVLTADATVTSSKSLTLGGLEAFLPGGELRCDVAGVVRVEGPTSLRGAAGARLRLVGENRTLRLDFVAGDADLVFEHLAVGNSTVLRGRFISPLNYEDLGNTIGWGTSAPGACAGRTAIVGDVVLATDEDAVAFNASGVQCIDGDLVFGGDVVFADLQALQRVTGTIRVRDGRAIEVGVGNVTEAGGVDVGGNDALTNLDLSGLVTVTGDVVIDGNDALQNLDLGDLETVDGNVVISGNDGLITVNAGALVSVGGDLVINDNDSLGAVTVPVLASVGGDLAVTGNANLGNVVVPVLASVGGDLFVSDNDSLVDLELGAVTGIDGSLFVGGNGQLVLIDLGALLGIGGDLLLLDNDALVAFVFAALSGVAGNVNILGNGALTSAGLPVLASVGGDLQVADNAGGGAGLDVGSLSAVGGDLVISDAQPVFQEGFTCDAVGRCQPVCGDNRLLTGEVCDDGNDDDNDGCSALCVREDGFVCAGAPSVCRADDDGDGVVDSNDVCPGRVDPGQKDTDSDGRGDACDTDDDNDGVADAVDDCPLVADAAQRDSDGDGRGDACGSDASDEAGDADNDGIADDDDRCLNVADASNADVDGDGLGDACDPDIDGDSIDNAADPCPLVISDACADDSDGDGTNDDDDNCVLVSNEQADLDGDGLGDACDSDIDGDGVVDRLDRCPGVASIESDDADNDGSPDACDRCPGVDDRLADNSCLIADDDDGGGCASTTAPPLPALLGALMLLARRRRR